MLAEILDLARVPGFVVKYIQRGMMSAFQHSLLRRAASGWADGFGLAFPVGCNVLNREDVIGQFMLSKTFDDGN